MQLSFRSIELEDKLQIEQFTKPLSLQSSDLTFTNLIMWGRDGQFQTAIHDDVLYVKSEFPGYPVTLFAPIPLQIEKTDYQRAVSIAEEYFKNRGLEPKFRSIHGVCRDWFETYSPDYQLEEDRDTFDYVYHAQDLVTLKGKRYHAKRNHINRFCAMYEYDYRPITPDNKEQCLALYYKWLTRKDLDQPGIQGEREAIEFLIPNMDVLGVVGGGIFIKDQLVAFSLGETIRDDTALIHIEKVDPDIEGLYALINQQFAQHAFSHLEYINREDDMGLEGLRKAKLSYYPAKLLEKYNAARKA